MSFKPIALGIGITRQCTAKCRHCAPMCSPKTTETLTENQLRKVLEDAKKAGIKYYAINGGEPFFKEGLLFDTLRHANHLGLKLYEIDTNAFWAKDQRSAQRIAKIARGIIGHENPDEAEKRFHSDVSNISDMEYIADQRENLLLNKIVRIHISADRFHKEFVPIQNVANAVMALAEAFPGSMITLNSLYLKEEGLDNPDPTLSELKTLLKIADEQVARDELGFITHFTKHPICINYGLLQTLGRARELPETDYYLSSFQGFNMGVLENFEKITLLSDAQVYLDWNGNFNPGYPIFEKNPLVLGNVNDISVSEAIEKANANSLVRFLMQRGAKDFIYTAIDVNPLLIQRFYQHNTVHGVIMEILNNGLIDRIAERMERELVE